MRFVAEENLMISVEKRKSFDSGGGFNEMKNRGYKILKPSMIFAFLIFLLYGFLYFSPAYGDSGGSGETQSIYQNPVVIDNQDEGAPGGIDEISASSEGTTGGKLSAISFSEIGSESTESVPFRRASGFDAFNANHQNQWKASFSKKTGKVNLLYGFTSKQYPGGPENVAMEFLRDSWTLFGMKQDLSDLTFARVDKTDIRDHVRLQQTYNGIPIADAFVLVHSNKENQVTMVQNNYIEGFQPSNQEQLPAESAIEIVRNDLRTSLGNNATFSEAKAERLIAPYQKAYYYAWNVMISTRNPSGLWVYRVDASNGQILHKSNRILSLYGSGSVYKNNANYLLQPTPKVTKQGLNGLLPLPSTNEVGFLFGSHAAIYTYKGDGFATPPYGNTLMYCDATSMACPDGDDPYDKHLQFRYGPTDPAADPAWFHAVNAYYKLNVIWNWWNQTVVQRNVNNKGFPSKPHYVPHFTDNYPIPVIVNDVDDAACNSFYTPDIHGNSSFQPGFVFGNENTCSFANENFVLDEDVVAHEFTHFMVDQCGFTAQGGQFDDASEYGDAMNEGNADFFAFLRTKNTKIGDVVWATQSPPYLRDINSTRMYPNDVDDPVDFTPPVPEAHYTGQIWSGYLYDLYKILGGRTLNYVFQGFYYFDPTKAGGLASGSYAQYLAEKDVTPGVPLSLKAAGAEASRGLNRAVGPCYYNQSLNAGDGPVGTYWVFPPTKSINTRGFFHNAGDAHEYQVEVDNAYMNLSVTVTSTSPALTDPVISLYVISRDSQGNIIIDPYSTTGCASVAQITKVGPSSPTSIQLKWPRLGAGLYSIVVTAAGTGNYNFSLSLR